MLKQRIMTAIALLAILIPALLYSDSRLFIAITLCMIAAAGWEWARLCGFSTGVAQLYGVFTFIGCASLYLLDGLPEPRAQFWIILSAMWIVFSVLALSIGVSFWTQIPRWVKAVGGFVVLVGAWSALAVFRDLGIEMLLSILCLVWSADIGAYFFGKRWSLKLVSRKLAPIISPGKSWEGVLGGFICVCFIAISWWKLGNFFGLKGPNLYSLLGEAHGYVGLIFALLALTTMSVVGDLVESFVKRGAGVKDSSQLLPGHGGVLDRIDALLPVLPMAVMLGSL
jgi:phosphatidate cytidylyltransferase